MNPILQVKLRFDKERNTSGFGAINLRANIVADGRASCRERV